MKRTSRFFKALSDQTRLRILWLLFRKGQATGQEIENILGISRDRVADHLKYLVNAGVVRLLDPAHPAYAVMQQTDPLRRTTMEGLRCRFCEPEIASQLEQRLGEWLGTQGA